MTKEIKTGKGINEIHVSPYTPSNLGLEKIILRQKDNITKKIIRKAKKNPHKKKWQENCQISYKKKDNNPSISNIDTNFKQSSNDGMTPNNCLTV